MYPQNNFHLPTAFRPRNGNLQLLTLSLVHLLFLFAGNPNFINNNNKRPYYQNNNHNQWQSWPNKRPRFEPPPSQPSSNRIDYRYVANQNTYQQQQQQQHQFH